MGGWNKFTPDFLPWNGSTLGSCPNFGVLLLCVFSRSVVPTLCGLMDCRPQVVGHQVPLPMGFLKQEYWSGLSCPPPEDLPDPGIEPESPVSPALVDGFFTSSAPWKPSKRLSVLGGSWALPSTPVHQEAMKIQSAVLWVKQMPSEQVWLWCSAYLVEVSDFTKCGTDNYLLNNYLLNCPDLSASTGGP